MIGAAIRAHLNRNRKLRVLDLEIVAIARASTAAPTDVSNSTESARWQAAAREAGLAQSQFESSAIFFPRR